MSRMTKVAGLLIGGVAALVVQYALERPASAITREAVLAHAKAFAYHPWRCEQKNLTASCSATYQSEYLVGDYVGLPYDWGGYMSLFEFDQQIAQGYGAGSYPADDVLDCTSGLDCSGFVSKCWDTGHWSTSTLDSVSSVITAAQMLPGDVYNQAGYHVVMFSHELANGMPVFYEAVGYNVHVNASTGYAWVSGFTPRRYHDIEGTTAGDPVGTLTHPIVISSLPYSADGDTSKSPSDVFDGCGASPSKPESGPEVVYQIAITEPGTLTASVSDDVGVDVDIHLYTSANTNDCVARDDSVITSQVDCGTYYLVVDTYGTGDGSAGPYSLTVQFTPSGQACGGGPAGYAPSGELGDSCAFPGHEDLPFCNENLGAETCIYTSSPPVTSFCSKACTSTADCAAFAGGCCEDIGSGEFYCLTAGLCTTPPPADAGVADAPTAPDAPAASDAGDSDAAAADGAAGHTDGPDSGTSDAAIAEEGGAAMQSTPPSPDGGCSCRTAAPSPWRGAWLAAFAAGIAVALRRARSRS